MSNKIKLVRIAQTGLSEIPQSMGTRIAIVTPNNEGFQQRTPLVRCRDFLCDVYSSSVQGKSFSIYGMSWDGKNNPLSLDSLSLLINFPDKAAKDNFFTNISKLYSIEQQNNFSVTSVIDTADISGAESGEILVIADAQWLMSVLSFSLYTLLLRILCYKLPDSKDWLAEFGKMSYSDSKYINNWPASSRDAIINNLQLLKMDEWNGLSYDTHKVGGVHHNSGIISVFSTHYEVNTPTLKQNTHWRHFREAGLETYLK